MDLSDKTELKNHVTLVLKEKILNIFNAMYESILVEAKFKKVTRIRGGKLQRRKKVSAKKGYRVSKSGKVVRMSSVERRRRKIGQRKGARKRKALKSKIAVKYKRALRQRKQRGL